MIKILNENDREIHEYCLAHGLDYAKIKKAPKSYNDDLLVFVHANPERGKRGLLDDTPSPAILWVRKTADGLTFEQTEHTREYLAN